MSQTKAQLISDLVQALNFTGTASAPANGVFLSATNTLAFATNSGSRVTIDSNGKATFSVDGVFNSINIGKGTNSVAGNTVVGEAALDAAVSGGNNTAIGHNALTDLTSGADNTAVGLSSDERRKRRQARMERRKKARVERMRTRRREDRGGRRRRRR